MVRYDMSSTDTTFFRSYDNFATHYKMLRDTVRMNSYSTAVDVNDKLFRGKRVLDLGAGTGILSLFAARAGALHVFAVDASNMIDTAREIAELNGLSHRITFIKAKVEDVKLPKIDIIISEWMGFCLLSEMMLDSLIAARNKHLALDGHVLPDNTCLYIAGIRDAVAWWDRTQHWDNFHGFDFRPLRKAAIQESCLRTPGSGSVVTQPSRVIDLDLQKGSYTMGAPIDFRLRAHRNDTVHALLAWFDYSFSAGEVPIHVSTGPFAPPTHWKQTVFYLDTPIELLEGHTVTGQVTFQSHERDLMVRFSYKVETGGSSGLLPVETMLYKVST